jgi:hypothetical protein
MTATDIAFVALAAIQLISIGFLAWVAIGMLERVKKGGEQVSPAIREAKALADTGKSIALHAREDGQIVLGRVKGLVATVKRRAATVKHIVTDMKAPAAETTHAVRITTADVRKKVETASDLAARLKRIRTAAEAAAATTRPQP